MAKGILTAKAGSRYDDVIEERYHFPQTYLNQAKQMVNDWTLFLRYLDDLELEKKDKAELKGKEYTFILDEEYRWAKWAVPNNPDSVV